MSWHKVADVNEISPGDRKQVTVEERPLTLIHTDEGLYCIDFTCPHTGGPLGDGELRGHFLTCPMHKWRFDLGDGTHGRRNVDCPPARVYALKREGEDILVEFNSH